MRKTQTQVSKTDQHRCDKGAICKESAIRRMSDHWGLPRHAGRCRWSGNRSNNNWSGCLSDHQLWPYSQCHQSHNHWYCHDYVTMLIMVWFRHRWRKIKWVLAFDAFYCHPHLHQHVIMIRTKTKHNLVKLQVLFRPTSLRLTSQSTPTWWRFPLDSISRFSLMIVI